MVCHRTSRVRQRALRKIAFSFANASAIGLKSGLYFGRNQSCAPTGFDRSSHRGALVTRQVVQDDDVARRERWRQDLLDVGQKTGAVDRPIKHGWRGEACHAQRPEKRRGVPAAIRRVVGDPGAGQPTAIAANQIGPHTTLIEKHEARGIERRRRGAPGRAGAADVSAIVFRRVYRFF